MWQCESSTIQIQSLAQLQSNIPAISGYFVLLVISFAWKPCYLKHNIEDSVCLLAEIDYCRHLHNYSPLSEMVLVKLYNWLDQNDFSNKVQSSASSFYTYFFYEKTSFLPLFLLTQPCDDKKTNWFIFSSKTISYFRKNQQKKSLQIL